MGRFGTASRRVGRVTAGAAVVATLVSCGGGGGDGYSTSPNGNAPGTNQTVASVAVTSGVSTVAVGSSVTLSAAAYNSGGTQVGATFAWSSSSPQFATVGASTGTVTGIAVGVTTITVSASGRTATRAITVTSGGDPNPQAVQVTMPGTEYVPGVFTLAVGGTVTWVFGAVTHNVNFSGGAGAPANIGNSTNESVSRTFNTAGTFTMTCTLHAGMTGTVTVQ